MVHGHHFDLGALERAEAALDDHQSFVAAGGILDGDGIVVGLQDPFAVIARPRWILARSMRIVLPLVTVR